MTKRRNLILFTIGIGLLLVGLGMYLFGEQRIYLSPEQFLLERQSFPTEWPAKAQPVEPVHWQVYTTSVHMYPEAAYRAASEAYREWRHNDGESNALQITQRVVCYESNAQAIFYYQAAKPEIAHDQWPHFTYPNVQPFYHSNRADQERFMCAMRGGDQCQIWYYWVRYSSCIQEVEFFAPNQGIDALTFAEIAANFDTHFTGQLQE